MASIAPKKGGRVFGRYYLMSPEEVSDLAHRRRAQLVTDALTLTLILVLIFIISLPLSHSHYLAPIISLSLLAGPLVGKSNGGPCSS